VALGSLAGCHPFLLSVPNVLTTTVVSSLSCVPPGPHVCLVPQLPTVLGLASFFLSFPKYQAVDCSLLGEAFSLPLDGRRNNCRENFSESCSAQE